MNHGPGNQPGSPQTIKPFQLPGRVCKWPRGLLAANDVGCLEAFRPLQQVELNRFSLVECPIAIFLYCGEVNENIFTSGPLNESVTLRPIKPLYCTLLSH